MKKRLVITLLSLISVACVSASVVTVAVNAQELRQATSVTWQQIELSSDLKIGDTLELPARSVTVDDKSYDATVKLIYPDGTAVVRTDTYPQAKLSLAGEYTLSFEARDDNRTRHKDEQTFVVSDKLWKTNNSKSTASYGVGNLAEDSAKGLAVSLQRGDTLTFGKIIDLSEITAETVLLSGYIAPKEQGSADFDRITFTFTDVYNPEITLSISGIRSKGSEEHAKGISYWTAWGNGQTPSGFEGSKFHHNDGYGAVYQHSWSAMKSYWSSDTDNGSRPCVSNTNPFTVRFDPAENKAYVAGVYITDLDDPSLHDGEAIWKGFESNKVMLTVSVDGVTGESANFCLTSVLGYTFSAGTLNSFKDADAPVITLNNDDGLLDENGNYVPYAVKGGSYPVAAATAFDEYAGAVSVQTEVYYNYLSESGRVSVDIENGRFYVEYPGTYTVVYTAKDYFGNTAKKLSTVTSVKELENPLSISIDGEAPSNGSCGERITLPGYSVSGGSGETKVVITAALGSETMVCENGVFLPETAGEWTITYTVSDVTALTATQSFNVTVTANANPVFVNDPVLPKYLIAKASYVVPEVYATDYSSGVKKNVLATLTVDGKTYNAGESFTIASSTVTDETYSTSLKFTAGNTSKVYEVATVNPYNLLGGKFEIGKLFVGSNFSYSRSDDGLKITASKAGDVNWEFANPVAANKARLLINGVADKDDFQSLQVTFTDAENSDIAVTVRIVNYKGENAWLAFGDADRMISQGFSLEDNSFEIGYNGTKFFVGNVRVTVKSTDDGAKFEGFPSGKVYISSKTLDAEKGASYIVKEMDNQPISNLSSDKTAPRIVINGEYGGVYDLGDKYVVTSAIVSDVIDPSATLTLTVTTPSGEIVSDVNGKELNQVAANEDYEILLSQVGQYKVVYNAKDSNNNKTSVTYGINLIDMVAPTVTFGKSGKTAKVGESFAFPSVTVSDDLTSAEDIAVYLTVRNPEGVLVELGTKTTEEVNGKQYLIRYNYTFRYAGDYTFMVLAMDEAGNQTLATYVVTVK